MSVVGVAPGDRFRDLIMGSASLALPWHGTAGVGSGEPAEVLAICRESGPTARALLEGLIDRTWTRYSEYPGAVEFQKAGLEPFDHPALFGGESFQLSNGGRAVLVRARGGTWALYVLGSAMRNPLLRKEEATDYAALLLRVLEVLRPRVVVAASVSRVIRHHPRAGELWETFVQSRVERMHLGDFDFDMSAPDDTQWQVAVMLASAERNTLMGRTRLGMASAMERGYWGISRASIPAGYMVGEDGKIEVNPDDVELVREGLRQMAESESIHVVTQALFDAGFRTARRRGVNLKHQVPTTEFRLLKLRLIRIRSLVEMYRDGVLAMDYEVTAHKDLAAARPVVRRDDGRFVLALKIPMPSPDGGWVEEAVFDRIARVAGSIPTRRGAHEAVKHRRVLPLLGYQWAEGDDECILSSNGTGSTFPAYRVLRRARDVSLLPEDSRRRAWHGMVWKANGIRLDYTVRADDLHRSIAEGLIEVLEEGLDATWFDTNLLSALAEPHEVQVLNAERRRKRDESMLMDTLRVAERAEEAVLSCPDGPRIDFLRRRADEAWCKVEALKEQLSRESVSIPQQGQEIPEHWHSDAQLILQVLSTLQGCPGRVDGEIATAIRQVVPSLQLTRLNELTIGWEIRLRVRVNELGADVLLGPASGAVRRGRSRYCPERMKEASARICLRAVGAAIELEPDQTEAGALVATKGHLKKVGLPGASFGVLGSQIVAPRATVWALLHGEDVTAYVADASDEWVQAIRTAHLEVVGRVSKPYEAGRHRQEIINYLRVNGPCDSATLAREFNRGNTKGPFPLTLHGLLLRWPRWNGEVTHHPFAQVSGSIYAPETLWSLYPCPHHCDGQLDLIVTGSECRDSILCSTCMRPPSDATLVFPVEYRDYLSLPITVDWRDRLAVTRGGRKRARRGAPQASAVDG